jgi:hypothetical protein
MQASVLNDYDACGGYQLQPPTDLPASFPRESPHMCKVSCIFELFQNRYSSDLTILSPIILIIFPLLS